MKSMMTKLLAATLLALGICGCSDDRLAGGGTDTEISILAGTVIKASNGTPVDGATVIVDYDNSLADMTNSTGTYAIDGVAYGWHKVYAYKDSSGVTLRDSVSVNVQSENTSVPILSLARSGSVVAKPVK
jgi:hypothetical protein